jgi:hypothetical protein
MTIMTLIALILLSGVLGLNLLTKGGFERRMEGNYDAIKRKAMAKHPKKPASPQDALRQIDGKLSNNQNHSIRLKTNTALQMPALPAPAISLPGECFHREESANLSAYGGDRV